MAIPLDYARRPERRKRLTTFVAAVAILAVLGAGVQARRKLARPPALSSPPQPSYSSRCCATPEEIQEHRDRLASLLAEGLIDAGARLSHARMPDEWRIAVQYLGLWVHSVDRSREFLAAH